MKPSQQMNPMKAPQPIVVEPDQITTCARMNDKNQPADERRDHPDNRTLRPLALLVAGQRHPRLGKEQRIPERAQYPLIQCSNQYCQVIEVQMMH
jgi:hypothetical protein